MVLTSLRLVRPVSLIVSSAALVLSSPASVVAMPATPPSWPAGLQPVRVTQRERRELGTTPATALASPITLLNRLAAGRVAVLQDGANFVLGGGEAITATGGTVGAPKTMRPTHGGRPATITTATGLWLQSASHDLVLEDLDISATAPRAGVSSCSTATRSWTAWT